MRQRMWPVSGFRLMRCARDSNPAAKGSREIGAVFSERHSLLHKFFYRNYRAPICLRASIQKQLWPLMCGVQSSQSKKPTTTDFWRLRSLLRDTGALRSVSLCYTSLQHLKHPIMTLTASTSQHLWFQSITPKIKHKPPCPWRKYSVNMNK